MIKKLLILIFVLLIIGVTLIPVISTKMGNDAFEHLNAPGAASKAKDAVKIKMMIMMFDDARVIAEKAALFFPESKDTDYFMVSAATCAERENLPFVAIYWNNKFIQTFPDHPWTPRVKNNLAKLKELNSK